MKRYKLSSNYIIQQIGEDTALLPCGDDEIVDFSKMIVLNETGAWMVSKMERDAVSEDELLQGLLEVYDVSLDLLKGDVEDFLNEMVSLNLLDVEE